MERDFKYGVTSKGVPWYWYKGKFISHAEGEAMLVKLRGRKLVTKTCRTVCTRSPSPGRHGKKYTKCNIKCKRRPARR